MRVMEGGGGAARGDDDDDDLPSAPSEQPTTAQGEHIKRQPRPREESGGAGRVGEGAFLI